MVLEHRAQPRLAAVVGAQQPAVLVAHAGDEEVGAGDRRLAIDVVVEGRGGVGERGDHERVPARQPLVVEPRPHALGARLVEPLAQLVAVRRVGRRADRDVRALEVALLGHPEVLDRLGAELVAERLADLGRRPDVELALHALGVRVERGGERALLLAQLGERPVERLAADAREALLAGDLPGVQVGAGEQRVVVEHLLEVRHEPDAVDRVAGEAAADLVVHAAGGHPAQRVQRHLALARARAGTRSRSWAGTSARARSRRARGRRPCAARRPRRRARRGRRPPPAASARPRRAGARRSRPPASGSPRAARPTRRRSRSAPAASSAAPGAAGAGSRCRTRTARRRGSGTRSAASRPARSSPAPRPCRSRRRRGAPRGRP